MVTKFSKTFPARKCLALVITILIETPVNAQYAVPVGPVIAQGPVVVPGPMMVGAGPLVAVPVPARQTDADTTTTTTTTTARPKTVAIGIAVPVPVAVPVPQYYAVNAGPPRYQPPAMPVYPAPHPPVVLVPLPPVSIIKKRKDSKSWISSDYSRSDSTYSNSESSSGSSSSSWSSGSFEFRARKAKRKYKKYKRSRRKQKNLKLKPVLTYVNDKGEVKLRSRLSETDALELLDEVSDNDIAKEEALVCDNEKVVPAKKTESSQEVNSYSSNNIRVVMQNKNKDTPEISSTSRTTKRRLRIQLKPSRLLEGE